MMTSLFIEIPTCGEIALPLQLTTGRSQLNPSYLMSLDFFEHWSTAVWNLELLCDQEVHEVEWRFGGIGRHYMRGHIPCISWTQVYKSAQAGVSSNQGVPSQKILKSFIFQIAAFGIWSLEAKQKESEHTKTCTSPPLLRIYMLNSLWQKSPKGHHRFACHNFYPKSEFHKKHPVWRHAQIW